MSRNDWQNETQQAHREIGERVKALRTAKGWTQEELAGRLGISRTSWKEQEDGRQGMKADTVIRLSALFDVSTDCILTGVQPENRTVAADLGLSDPAIEYLKEARSPAGTVVDFLLTHNTGRRLLFMLSWYMSQDFEGTILGLSEPRGEAVSLKGLAIGGLDEQGRETSYLFSTEKSSLAMSLGEAIEQGHVMKMEQVIRQLRAIFREEAAAKAQHRGGRKHAEEE